MEEPPFLALSFDVILWLKARHLPAEINKRESRILAARHILFIMVLELFVILVIRSTLLRIDAGRPSVSLLEGLRRASGLCHRPSGRNVNRIESFGPFQR